MVFLSTVGIRHVYHFTDTSGRDLCAVLEMVHEEAEFFLPPPWQCVCVGVRAFERKYRTEKEYDTCCTIDLLLSVSYVVRRVYAHIHICTEKSPAPTSQSVRFESLSSSQTLNFFFQSFFSYSTSAHVRASSITSLNYNMSCCVRVDKSRASKCHTYVSRIGVSRATTASGDIALNVRFPRAKKRGRVRVTYSA